MFLNLVLVSLLGVAGWRARQIWEDARQREQMVLLQQIQLKNTLPPPPIPVVGSLTPMTYVAVAQQMIFAKDRNPTVIIEAPPTPPSPPPMPPLPAAAGAMTFNGETSVFLTAKLGGPQGIYKVGDQVGPFKLLAVSQTDIVFDWDGKRVERKLAELQPKVTGVEVTEAQAGPPPPTSSAPVATSIGGNSSNTQANAPGKDVGNGQQKTCQVGDTSPNGTVIDGFKKVVAASMMGQSCHWEAVK